jgi:hypothetical protein
MAAPTKSFKTIVKGFTKTISDLERLANSNTVKSNVKVEKMTTLNNEVETLDAEKSQALTLKVNLEKLIGVTK